MSQYKAQLAMISQTEMQNLMLLEETFIFCPRFHYRTNVLTCYLIVKLLFGHQRSGKLYQPEEYVQGTIRHDQSNRNAEVNVVKRNWVCISIRRSGGRMFMRIVRRNRVSL